MMVTSPHSPPHPPHLKTVTITLSIQTEDTFSCQYTHTGNNNYRYNML